MPNVKSNAIILSILRMVYAEIALGKIVNWMIMRRSSKFKFIVSSMPNIPREQKFIDGGLGRMMDHAFITHEEVEWLATLIDDDRMG
jgi:hypothetical protein